MNIIKLNLRPSFYLYFRQKLWIKNLAKCLSQVIYFNIYLMLTNRTTDQYKQISKNIETLPTPIMQKPLEAALFHQKYTIQNQIGRGASGVCYKIRNTLDSKVYALKKISEHSLKKNNLRQACQQVTLLSSLKHPNIIKYFQSFIDDNNLFIVMQYASKGDLHAILKKRKANKQFYSESQIWNMCRQLVEALEYLHNKNIIHRDIKTLNIFAGDENQLIIGDLGVSKIIKTDLGLYSRVGTPLYLSPEIIKYQKYDFKADIWGLGCVAYLLTTLNHPFQGKNIISLGQNIVNTDPKPIQGYSPKLKDLIFDMLDKNHLKRPSAQLIKKKYFQANLVKQIKPDVCINNFVCSLTQEEEKPSLKQFNKKSTVNQDLKNELMKKIDSKLSFQKQINYKHISQKRKQVYIINNIIQEKSTVQEARILCSVPTSDKFTQQKNTQQKSLIPDTDNNLNNNLQTTIIRKPSQKANQFELKNEQLTQYKNGLSSYEIQKKQIITGSVNLQKPIKSQIKSWITSNQVKKKLVLENQQILSKKKQLNSVVYPTTNLKSQVKNKWIKKVSYSAKCFQPSSDYQFNNMFQSNQFNKGSNNNNAIGLKKTATQTKFNQFHSQSMNKAESQSLFILNQKKGRIFRSAQRSNSQTREPELRSKQTANFSSLYSKNKEPSGTYAVYTHSTPCSEIVEGIQRKFRDRPKSSIGKGRHQSTMKQLRPYKKKYQIEQIQSMIQTKILKKPQRIVI